jgi:hypothetical protein
MSQRASLTRLPHFCRDPLLDRAPDHRARSTISEPSAHRQRCGEGLYSNSIHFMAEHVPHAQGQQPRYAPYSSGSLLAYSARLTATQLSEEAPR